MYCQIILVFYFVLTDSSPAPTHLLVTRLGPCFDPQETIVKVPEYSVKTQIYVTKLSGVLNITEKIRNGWKIKATMQKCMDIRNIDTCDFYKSFFVVKNGCSANEDVQSFYGTLFNYARPKIDCPIRAGRYELRNYPINSEDYVKVYESKISTSVFGYTFRLDGFTVDRRKMFCIEAYLQMLSKRDHDWTRNSKVQVTSVSPKDIEEVDKNK